MGDFVAELREPPDAELLAQLETLADFLRSRIDEVWDKVYEHYLNLAEHREWLKSCGVPLRLGRRSILPYLRSRQIFAERFKGKVDGTIFIDPQWDVEHKIYLRFEGNLLQFADC